MARALLTDLYEIRMAASYLRRGMVAPATFSLFVRRLPPGRGFLVAAGLADCLSFLEEFRFEEDELAYLRDAIGLASDDLARFRELRFTGDVWAIPEGRIVLPDEPLLEVTAPIAEAQLVETYLLNHVSFQTTIASKAARSVIAAAGRSVVDFAMRRTQGPEAAMAVARASAIVGFDGTSNTEAARRFGLRPVGTMAHSYVQAFPDEHAAFDAFAADFPQATTFLVDTYDTPDGVRAAADIIRERRLSGPLAIRLDSGDLAALARESRAILDAAGLPAVRILASGSLDEYAVDALVRGGAPIDAFGVGTKMGVSADAPYLDSVYKLVAFGDRPVMKLSPAKVTAPGAKQVFRAARIDRDILGLREEETPDGFRPILERVMVGGRRLRAADGILAARQQFEEDLAALPEPARRVARPVGPSVSRSAALRALTAALTASLESTDHGT